MIAGLDSSFFRPASGTALKAKAAGVGLWSGYLATKGGVGLASPWDRASFENARLCGGQPIAYCSGFDDPAAVRRLADIWSVKPCLDVEGGGLRPDGTWVQPFLNASAAGLYGNPPVFAGRTAAFYVIAGYPGYDPGRTWGYVGRPNGPCGWQWRGSADEFGGSTDRGWFDSWFGQGVQPIPEEDPMLYVLQGDQKPHCWLSDGITRRYIGDLGELQRWLARVKKPIDKTAQYDVDRIPVSFRVPENLTDTGLVTYDDVVFGPGRLPAKATGWDEAVDGPEPARAVPETAWAPSDAEVEALHEKLGFYPVVGADHKA